MSISRLANAAVLDLDNVVALLSELERNLEVAKLSLKQQEKALGEVKVHGRHLATSAPIFTKQGIATLSRYGFDRGASTSSREALRCLANAFLLNGPSRQIFVDLGYGPKAAERLKTNDYDDEFLVSRILFLMTYNTTLGFEDLCDRFQLAESINQNLARHAQTFLGPGHQRTAHRPNQTMALEETLKLLFNITHHHPRLTLQLASSLQPLVDLLMHHPLAESPLRPPTTLIINALLNFDLNESNSGASSEHGTETDRSLPGVLTGLVERVTFILDKAISIQPERELDQAAMPLCTLTRRIYELGSEQTRSSMRQALLPNGTDREKPLGQSETLASRLLRLSCSPGVPTLRENISALLFEMSGKDAAKFVQNVGYGFASGFLMSHDIEISATTIGEHDVGSGDDDDAGGSGAAINPITGQKISAERRDQHPSEEMTDDEKLREAERLFVLIERLKATGVVDVKNPVQQALDEGRFEELD